MHLALGVMLARNFYLGQRLRGEYALYPDSYITDVMLLFLDDLPPIVYTWKILQIVADSYLLTVLLL